MNNVIGSYVPYNSIIHRIDPRVKFIGLILLMVCAFLSFNDVSWATTFFLYGMLFIFVLVIMVISRVSLLKILKSLRAMWVLVLFILIINMFFPAASSIDKEWIAFTMGSFNVYWDSILLSLKIVLRLLIIFSLAMVLTGTTKPLDLTFALEWFMIPLKLVKFPVHIVAMTMSLALRFIPTLMEETRRLMKAQASRGLDYNKGGVASKFRGVTALIVPLFVSAFSRSEDLANAMIARGYDPYQKRTRYQSLRFHYRDLFAFLLICLIFAGFLVLFIMKIDVVFEISKWFTNGEGVFLR